jgi:predicted nucleic acid-binding protein
MAYALLLDSDVLIDYLRSRAEAVEFLEARLEPLLISAVTVAELYAGVREGKERTFLDQFVRAFEVVPVDDEIARRGGLYRRDFGSSHGTELTDALIAASAEQRRARVVTLNDRHFPMLSDVLVPYRKVSR